MTHPYFIGKKTAGHIPREISLYIYFFIKDQNEKLFVTWKSLKYKVTPVHSGGLEVPLSMTFSCKKKWVMDVMEKFVTNVYSFEYSRNIHSINDTNDSDDEQDTEYQAIILETQNVEEEISSISSWTNWFRKI